MTFRAFVLVVQIVVAMWLTTFPAAAADGEVQTWDAVRETIKQVIDNEDKARPLSDEDIVKALAGDGVNIARRTVTKYRKELSILPASKRKKIY